MARYRKKALPKIFLGQWLEAIPSRSRAGCAKAAGVDISYINNMIDGRKDNPAAAILKPISEYLGITMNDLYRHPPQHLRGLSPAAIEVLTKN